MERGWCLPTHPGSRHGTCNLGLLHQLYCRDLPYRLSVKKKSFIYPHGLWIFPNWRFHGYYKPVLLFVLLHTIIFYVNKRLFCWLFYFVFHFLKQALWLQKVRRRIMQRAYRCKHGSYGNGQCGCWRGKGREKESRRRMGSHLYEETFFSHVGDQCYKPGFLWRCIQRMHAQIVGLGLSMDSPLSLWVVT